MLINPILLYVQLLVEAGADIDKRQPEDDTPLILASREGFLGTGILLWPLIECNKFQALVGAQDPLHFDTDLDPGPRFRSWILIQVMDPDSGPGS